MRFPPPPPRENFVDKKLIDRGDYYEIENYEPIIKRDESGNIISIINCPYIPKFFVDGGEQVRRDVVKVRVDQKQKTKCSE